MAMGPDSDILSVRKGSGSDWVYICMKTNGQPNGAITIRSLEMAEGLHFMLGQMLGRRTD
jgi:hypothetical protein